MRTRAKPGCAAPNQGDTEMLNPTYVGAFFTIVTALFCLAAWRDRHGR